MNRLLMPFLPGLVLTLCVLQHAEGAEVRCFVLQPPEHVLSGVQKVAVLDFAGQGWRAFSDYMIAALLEPNRGITTVKSGLFSKEKAGVSHLSGARTDVFTVVERNRLDAVIREQSLGNSGVVDEKQAASLGKVLGVDAVVIGSITPSSNDQVTRREETVYSGGQKTRQLVDWVIRTVDVSVRMRVINTSTGEILGTKAGKADRRDTKIWSERGGLASVESLIDDCLKELACGDMVNYIAPRFVASKFKLKPIALKEYKAQGQRAAEAAENGDLDNAFVQYAAIQKNDPYNDAAYHNLGLLNEVVGNYAEAQDAYQKALAIRQDGDYSKSLERCNTASAYAQTLATLGVEIVKHPFAVSEGQMQSASAGKVTLKGGSGDRVAIRAAAQSSAEIVARVPGGIELELVEKSGGWIKVKTFDGKTGYVPKEQVK